MATSLPQYMRAAQFSTNPIEKNLKVNPKAPLPKTAHALRKDTTLVKVAYSSLNPVDYKVLESPAGYILGGTPAVDIAGVVVDSKLPHVKAGDRVYGMTAIPSFGALAEYAVVPKDGLALAPEGVKLEDLATLGVTGLTAWQTLSPFIKSGDKVLINGGSGGVGTFAIQIAKALGAHVTTTCSGGNVELCKSLGADEVIDYRATDLVPHLKQSGVQFDHIFDSVFYNFDLYWQAHHYLKKNAKFVTIAGEFRFDFVKTMLAIYLLPSFLGGGQRQFQFVTATANAPEYEKLGALIKEGKIKPVIESVLDLDEAGKGYAKLKTGRTRGKIVVKVAGE
ncbi:hypothetical protein AMS68_002255 [Peltaster fructicola]|uniref:Enoyl reductase (ER) domain-containing protein n=1 Tax=Peltaster fructicola TaxID=286661 RepID=A0A6H0XQ24_9PEZI|nr:hypothetical protein AMS68_002255 [Peltaster fructicola]